MIAHPARFPQVTVYSKRGCDPCTATTVWLTTRDVPHRTVDLDEHPEQAARLTALGHFALPVTEIGGQTVAGFRPEVFAELLGLREQAGAA